MALTTMVVLMGADIAQAEPMRSAYLTLTLGREEDAERVYALLADGGEIFMKMEKTPFANRFAMLRDKVGTCGCYSISLKPVDGRGVTSDPCLRTS